VIAATGRADSVLFGNTVPIKVLGYGPLPEAAGGDPTRSA
jgi:hypothetical protein